MSIIKWIVGGGNWNTAANWSTNTVPTAGDRAVIDAAGNYVVAVTAPIDTDSIAIDISQATLSINDPGHVETVASDFSNAGALNVDTGFNPGGSSLVLGGSLNNDGVVNIGNDAIVQPASVAAAGIVNTGTINLHGNGAGGARATLDIADAAGFGTAGTVLGTVNVLGNALVEFASGSITSIVNGAQLSLNGSAAFVALSGNIGSNSALTGLTGNAGHLILFNGASISTTGDFANRGIVEIDDNFAAGGSSLNVAGTLTNSGTVVVGFNDTSVTPPAMLTAQSLNNTGTVNVVGGAAGNTAALAVNEDSANAGNVNISAFATLSIAGAHTYRQVAGSTKVSGTLNSADIAVSGGTLEVRGNVTADIALGSGRVDGSAGTITGNLNETGGSLYLGTNFDAPGTLTIDGDYTASGGLVEQIIRGTASTQFGTLNVAGGNVDLSGAIFQADVSGLGLSLAAGQRFRVMNFAPGSLTGTFSAVHDGAFVGTGTSVNIGGGLSLNMVYDNAAGHIDLNVVNTPAGGIHWIGGSANWNTAAKWSTGSPPTGGDDAIIDAAGNYTVSVTTPIALNSISVVDTNATLSINDAGVTEQVTGFLTNAGTVNVDIFGGQGGTTLAVGGRLSNGGTLNIGNTGLPAPTAVDASELVNFGTINVNGGTTNRAELNVAAAAGFGTAGSLTGNVNLQGNALVEFASGQITTIDSNASLSLVGAAARVADASDTTTSSALTGLSNLGGTFALRNGAVANIGGALANTGFLFLDQSGGLHDGGSSLTIGGTLSNSNVVQVGNGNLSAAATLTAAGLANSGEIDVFGSASNQATLSIGAAAGFGSIGVLTGHVTISGEALLEFSNGQIATIADNAYLQLSGSSAHLADATDTTSNSALTGLSAVDGQIEIINGASVTTGGPLTNTGMLQLDRVFTGGSSLAVGGLLTNRNLLQVGNPNISAPDTVNASGLVNTGEIDIFGGAGGLATLNIGAAAGFGSDGILTGRVVLGGNALLEFTSGQITTIAGNAYLQLNGSNARLADATDTNSNSALTGLGTIFGQVEIINGASVTTGGPLTNAGVLELDRVFTGGSSLTIGGLLTNSNFLQVGNVNISISDSMSAAGLLNTGEIDLFGNAAHPTILTINGAASDTGTVNIGTSTNLAVTGGNAFSQSAGTTSLAGTLTAANVNLSGGVLAGIGGTIIGNLNETGGDVLVAVNANTPASLTVQGDYADGSTGLLEMLLKGTATGQFSTVHVTGGVDLTGGTLQFDLGQNFTLLGGQTFDLMTFAPGGLTGEFNTTKFGAFTGNGDGVGIGNGLALFVDYDNAGGKIELQVKNTNVTITAPTTLHAFTQFPQLILPLSVADIDPGLAPLTMTLTDTIGLLSAHAAGTGTVSGVGTNHLTLTGTLADLNAELASVAYTGGAPNSTDQIVLQVTDQHGVSAPQSIAVTVDPVPVTSAVVHGPQMQTLVAELPTAASGLSVSDPYAEATGAPIVVDVTSDFPITLTARGTGGVVLHQGTDHIQVAGTVANVNSYFGDSIVEFGATLGTAALAEYGAVHGSDVLAIFKILSEITDNGSVNEGQVLDSLIELPNKFLESGALAPPTAFLEIGISSVVFGIQSILALVPGSGQAAPDYETFKEKLTEIFEGKLAFALKKIGTLDPHIVTSDGLTYSVNAAGEFLLAASTQPDDFFQVQARFEPYNNSAASSTMTEVAAELGGDRVTFDIHRPDTVWVNGSPTVLSPGMVIDLGAGQVGQISSHTYGITWNTGESLTVTDNGSYLDVTIDVGPNTGSGVIAGLLGSHEGAANDFQLPDGAVLPQPLTTDELYQSFANSWRIPQSFSILDYGPGQTTATFTDPSFPNAITTLADLPQSLVQLATAAVTAAGITDAGAAAAAELDYLASGGNPQVIVNDASFFRGLTTTQAVVTRSGPAPTVLGVIGHSPQPVLTAGSGPTPVVFDVYLTTATNHDTTVDYQVIAGGPGFFDATTFGGALPTGQVVIAAGQTVAQFTVNVPQGALGASPSENLAVEINSTDGTAVFAPTSIETVAQAPEAGPPPIPELTLLSNIGTFTHTGNHYTLDLGEVRLGQPLPILQFGIDNEATTPADQLAGTFEVASVAGFKVNGAVLPGPLDPGQSYQGLVVVVNTGAFDQVAAVKFGLANELITFHPQDLNASGYSAAMDDLTLEINYTLTPSKAVFSYAYGDVHIITYDKLHYDFQGVGEFTLAKSRVAGDSFDIQMRLTPWLGNGAVSVVSEAAISLGADRVTFDANRADEVWVNGSATTLSLANPTLTLAGGQITEISSTYFHVTWNTGEEMWVNNSTSFGPGLGGPAHLDISDSVPVGLPGFIGGLQGFDEGQANDFQLPDGTVLPQPLDCDTLYGMYADAWRVTQATSLFDYAPGQTTATFTDQNFPGACLTLANLPPDLVAHAMALVAAAGIVDPATAAGAAFDYILTGDPTFISGAAQIAQNGFIGTPAVITMDDPVPAGVGVAALAPKYVEATNGLTHAVFEAFLTNTAATDTLVTFSVIAPTAGFLDAAAFGGTFPTGQVTILAGQRTAQFTIDVPQNALGLLPSEMLEVQVSAPGGNPVFAAVAQTEIVNNEPEPGAAAVPVLASLSGLGTFTHVGNAYALDLGGLTQGELVDPLQFAVVNTTTAPADALSGTFSVPTGTGFTVIGNNLATPVAAGQSYEGLFFAPATNGLGAHSMTLVLHPTDVNDSGYSSALDDITLTVTDTVAAAAKPAVNTPTTIIFPNVRVGTPESQPVSITNTAAQGAASLDVTLTPNGDATASGSISHLAPGATDYTDLSVGLDTSSAGARSGYVTENFSSELAGGHTTAIALQNPYIDVFGSVYRVAAADIAVSHPILHVGDPGIVALAVTNTDVSDGYSEDLIATLTGASGGIAIRTGGPTGHIAAGASDTSTLTLSFSTAVAGVVNGNATVGLFSDGGIGASSIDGLGQLALDSQSVPVSITVNNYAVAVLQEISGGGTLTHNGNSYTLDLGKISQGSGLQTIDLGLANTATGPADLLAGAFDLSGDGAFSTTSFDPVDAIGAGGSVEIGMVTLDTSHAGFVSETITLHPEGYNASDFSGELADQTLTITAQIQGEGGENGPVAQGGLLHGTEDTAIQGMLSATDTDGAPLSFSGVTQTAHGTLHVAADGSFVYTPNPNYFGPDGFNFQASNGITESNIATMSLFIDPVNDAPVNTVPAVANFEANAGGAITGLSIADDSGSGLIQTTLSVFFGILKIGAHPGVSITGNGTDHVMLSGTLDDINAALAAPDGVHYTSPHDFFGIDTLTFTTNDQGNTGIGGPMSDTDTMAIHLNTFVPGTTGNDSFHAGPGNQYLLGWLGNDTVSFDFALVDAKVSYEGHLIVVDGPSSHTVLSGFEVFNFTDGTVHNDDSDALVDDLYYYSHNHDVWTAHVDADTHYHTIGWKEGRDPNAFFSTKFYLGVYKDVAAAGVDPLTHFDQNGWKEGRVPSTNFDPQQYAADYNDITPANIDPLKHFLQIGMNENRLGPGNSDDLIAPNGFDYAYYLLHNPDVAASGVDPFVQYETTGWKEGRNPNAFFDDKGYLATYVDVAASGMNPLDHYHQYGWLEGRDPSPNFDTKKYLAAYPDVAAAHIDPLEHYLQYGNHEGRSTFADGVWG